VPAELIEKQPPALQIFFQTGGQNLSSLHPWALLELREGFVLNFKEYIFLWSLSNLLVLRERWKISLKNYCHIDNFSGLFLIFYILRDLSWQTPQNCCSSCRKINNSLGFLRYLIFKGKIAKTNFEELLPCLAISWKLLKSFSCKGEIVKNPKELLSKLAVLGGVSNLLDLRQILWQTLKNCSPQWPFLRGFPNL